MQQLAGLSPSPCWASSCGRVVLYRADCMEVLPSLAPGLVYITDQPYGTGWVRGGKKVGEFAAKHEKPELKTVSTPSVPCRWM